MLVRTAKENKYSESLSKHLRKLLSTRQKNEREIVEGFPLYAPRQELSRFLARHELFKKILLIKGSILECGIFRGFGLMTWAELSAIYEPTNYHRQIIGFDTFTGFPKINQKDRGSIKNPEARPHGAASASDEELEKVIKLFDNNRYLSHIPKIKLVRGDFLKTGPKFLEQNPHLLISLLFLDFDLYEPTKEALRLFLPRMPKGAVLAFDEINNPDWPGETQAFLEATGLSNHCLKQFSYEPNISYLVL